MSEATPQPETAPSEEPAETSSWTAEILWSTLANGLAALLLGLPWRRGASGPRQFLASALFAVPVFLLVRAAVGPLVRSIPLPTADWASGACLSGLGLSIVLPLGDAVRRGLARLAARFAPTGR